MSDVLITAEQFEKATGQKSEKDDLERCNCNKAGELGHLMCGWNKTANLPVFMCGKRI